MVWGGMGLLQHRGSTGLPHHQECHGTGLPWHRGSPVLQEPPPPLPNQEVGAVAAPSRSTPGAAKALGRGNPSAVGVLGAGPPQHWGFHSSHFQVGKFLNFVHI